MFIDEPEFIDLPNDDPWLDPWGQPILEVDFDDFEMTELIDLRHSFMIENRSTALAFWTID